MSAPLYFITGNANKFRETSAIVPGLEQLKLELDEIQALDPEVVIAHKLEQAAKQHKGAFIVEDSSVSLDCLGGSLPGPFIKWFLDALGTEGIADLVSRYDNHRAVGRVIFGYRDEQGHTEFFSGELTGTIVAPRGKNGFGFDPIFIADGETRTNAELNTEEKNAISSRGQAARKLAAYLAARTTAT